MEAIMLLIGIAAAYAVISSTNKNQRLQDAEEAVKLDRRVNEIYHLRQERRSYRAWILFLGAALLLGGLIALLPKPNHKQYKDEKIHKDTIRTGSLDSGYIEL